MEYTLDQALKKGIDAHKAGKAQEADQYYTAILKANPKHPDANHNMGVLAVGVGKVEEALPFFKTALEVNPKTDQFWLSYLNALIKLNRIDEANAVLDQAKNTGARGYAFGQIEKSLAELKPILKAQEPPKEQIDLLIQLYSQNEFDQVFNKAQKLKEQYNKSLMLWNLIGGSATQLGKLDEAVIAFQNAISIKPDFFEAYNNMGNAFKQQGKQDKAVYAYKKALLIKPDVAQVHYNIGNALNDQGKLEDAVEAFNNAISIDPDYSEAYNNLGNALKGVIFTKPNKDLQKAIVSLIVKKRYIRPIDIAKAAIGLLKFEPSLRKHLKLVETEVVKNPLDVISDISNLTLLLKLMVVCPLADWELERLLTNLRYSILLNMSLLNEASPKLTRFQSALALQCFTNDYIYQQTEEEEKKLGLLESSVTNVFRNNGQPSPHVILILASYKPLRDYDWNSLLVVTDEIRDVFLRQVEEPIKEEKLKKDLPMLEQITDNISLEVKAQYEESPYPRWVNSALHLKPLSISEVVDEINLKIHYNKISEVKEPEILIAGCGTGQQSIGTATRFKSSTVLAIDLSLSSLAYAKRKTEELGIENIKYMQGDILDLARLNKKFDIIESSGVLHHMNDPLAGWKVLSDCLKPGGLINIGLYSELARKDIIKTKSEISQMGIGSSNAEMKAFRANIMKSEKAHHKKITFFSDFYSLSELRDLLFHIQEHRFTIPLMKDYLDNLGLKFCGFETKQIVSHFTQTNKAKDDPYDLDKWQVYEHANPRAFAGMYQFWCQKMDLD